MLSLWNPFINSSSILSKSEKSRYKDPFERLFDGLFEPLSHYGAEQKLNSDGSLILSLDLPGIKEQDLSVELSPDNLLTIKGERKTSTSSYSVHKSFTIGDQYEPETLRAELKDGVLSIEIQPKKLSPAKESKKIPILSGKPK